jgi:hypothetical protein
MNRERAPRCSGQGGGHANESEEQTEHQDDQQGEQRIRAAETGV